MLRGASKWPLAQVWTQARALVWALALCLALAATAQAQPADPKTEAQIKALMQKLAQAYVNKDFPTLMESTAPEAVVVVRSILGEDRQAGRERIRLAYEPELRAARAPSLAINAMQVSARGTRAQVTADLTAGALINGERLRVPARFTALFDRRGGRWLLLSAYVQYPLVGDNLGDIFSLGQ